MEVASPLPLPHSRAGSKRSYVCSPFLNTTEASPFPGAQVDSAMGMDENSGYVSQPYKRRRFSETKVEANKSFPAFASPSQATSPLAISNLSGQPINKRARTDSGWNQTNAKQQIVLELKRVVDQQAAEIERLKSEKESVENCFSQLKSQHEKIAGENRILKKAVTIQQERQNQASAEIEAACKYRSAAEDRIRKLEQMNLNLKYHLQASSCNGGNDFMGFNPRPPDVY